MAEETKEVKTGISFVPLDKRTGRDIISIRERILRETKENLSGKSEGK